MLRYQKLFLLLAKAASWRVAIENEVEAKQETFFYF